ncbi:hypothetical protein [Luteimonas sp. R10]|uniref:hypothetical protein n=1 Tax=Luteimonas sp. R10 TaxID=3108176 RepID=UPI00308F7D5E|nr:hypothetical protein U3649_14070 [Luteimonas sp. R10]
MRRWLRRAGIVLLALLAALALLWSGSRLRGPTQVQRHALQLMASSPQPEGRNAFPALWLLPYDVPNAEQEAVAAEDVERMRARLRSTADDPAEVGLIDLRTVAHERYRDLRPSDEDEKLFCRPRERDCLLRVRAAPDVYRALAARNSRLFERIEALSGYDHYRSLLPLRLEVPFPELQHGRALLTRHAVQFVHGEVDAALAGACRDVSTWRRLGGHSDSLVMRMIGIAYSTGAAGLLADMLAELPMDHPLPAGCAAAFEPPPAEELWLCEPMRGEFAYSTGTVSALREADDPASSVLDNLLWPVLLDVEMTRAEMAGSFASFCAPEELQRVAADRAGAGARQEPGLLRLECVGNAVGCILANIAAPAYQPYQLRAQDHGAKLKLVATLLWLRAGGENRRPLAERIDRRPDAYKSPTREVEIAEDGRALRIQLFETGHGGYWQVPLPPDLQEPAS